MSAGVDEEAIISEILARKPGLTREKLEELVREKILEFGGIIRRDAALLLVAKELGVQVTREIAPRVLTTLRIRDLAAGFRGVDLEGYILAKSAVTTNVEGRSYVRFLISDGDDAIWATAWGNLARELSSVRIFSKVLLRKASVVRRRGRLEISLSEGSQIEVRGMLSLSEAVELLQKFKVKTDVLLLRKIGRYSGGLLAFGLDARCNQVALHVQGDLLAGEPRLLIASNCAEERAGSLRVLKCREGCVLEPWEAPAATLCREEAYAGLSARGVAACFLLFRRSGGKALLVNSEGEALELLIFSDHQLLRVKELLGRSIEVWGLLQGRGGIKLSPYSLIEDIPEAGGSFSYSRACLLTAAGSTEVEATFVSLKLRYRCVEGRPLYHIAAVLDDGTASMRAVSNAKSVLRKIYGLEEEELCSATPSSIDAIADYVAEELLGGDAVVRGQVVGKAERIFVMHDIDI